MSSSLQNGSSPFGPEDCLRVLEGVAASSCLKRAARLREFLLYIGRKSVEDNTRDLHEHEIGHTVFGRKESYDTSQDNIVRVSATELRKRVETYFAIEGKDEPLIFEIPRGSYTPVFRLRAQDAPTPGSDRQLEKAAPDLASVTASLRRAQLALALVSGVTVVLAVVCLMLWWQMRSLP